MSDNPTATVRVSRSIAAPAPQVFDAWIDPTIAGRWLFATPTGTMVRVEIDPRVGGRFAIVEKRNGEEIEHVGEYVRLDRPRQLVFNFAVPKFSDLSTMVSVDIANSGGNSQLTLTHEGVLPDYRERTEAGWNMLLGNLAAIVEQAN